MNEDLKKVLKALLIALIIACCIMVAMFFMIPDSPTPINIHVSTVSLHYKDLGMSITPD